MSCPPIGILYWYIILYYFITVARSIPSTVREEVEWSTLLSYQNRNTLDHILALEIHCTNIIHFLHYHTIQSVLEYKVGHTLLFILYLIIRIITNASSSYYYITSYYFSIVILKLHLFQFLNSQKCRIIIQNIPSIVSQKKNNILMSRSHMNTQLIIIKSSIRLRTR